MARASSPEPSGFDEVESDTLAAPMASLFEVTKLRNLRVRDYIESQPDSALANDFISVGRVNLQDAEDLFMQFTVSLNQYLWGGVALVHDNLTSVRKSSSLLASAIIAVTALHVRDKEEVFDAAYTEFLSLVSESMFDRRHSLDDIRAFCIGAFWLSDVSCKYFLSSLFSAVILISVRETLGSCSSDSDRTQSASKFCKGYPGPSRTR
jgi:hypothetical protein